MIVVVVTVLDTTIDNGVHASFFLAVDIFAVVATIVVVATFIADVVVVVVVIVI